MVRVYGKTPISKKRKIQSHRLTILRLLVRWPLISVNNELNGLKHTQFENLDQFKDFNVTIDTLYY